eukprot:COSAG02_NODE_3850_length_6147_cov_7.419478_6_plen_60_part_00
MLCAIWQAYFANIESLRLLALQILKGSPERPGYRAADGVGDDWQINAGSVRTRKQCYYF